MARSQERPEAVGALAGSAAPVAQVTPHDVSPRRRPGVAQRLLEQKWFQLTAPIVGIIVLWQVLSTLRLIDPAFFPPPSRVAETLWTLTASGEVMVNLDISMRRIFVGFVIGTVPGIILGLLMGWSAVVHRTVDPLIAATYPVPKIAILPLLLVIFGLGNAPIIALTAIVCFYPVVINAMAGVRSVEPVLIRMATNLGATKPQIMLKIVLPGALPVMFAGLRLALGLALLGDVAAEFAMSSDGVGALTWLYWQVYQIENMYAYLTVIAILGALLTYGLEWLGRWLMPWSRPLRGE